MCQHYEHSAAESTIDLDSSHHMCRKFSESLLSPRCDRWRRAPNLGSEEQPTPQTCQEHSRRLPHPNRLEPAAMSAATSSQPLRASDPNGR